MIIWINGAFGTGKTSTAYMLQPLIENSIIFDPEEVGLMLRRVIPSHIYFASECTGDFQDLELWRILTLQTIIEIKKKYNNNLIIPSTIYKYENLKYILDGLRKIDKDVHHFCLVASEKTIVERLQKRGDGMNGWAYRQIPNCIHAFKNENFEQFIETDSLSIDEIVEQMISKLKIYLRN